MKRKTTLFLPVLLLLAILLTVSASAAAFEDVPEDAYFAPAVQWALDNGVTTGTSSTTFSPDATCTRGQVVTFLWRASGCPEPEAGSCPFTDVAPGSYYEKAVLWAVEYGITNGTSETEFSPDALCTSAHILTFLFRSLEEAQPVITETLPGVDPNAYYAKPLTWASNNDMLRDMEDFEINAPCSRAMTVTWLFRAFSDTNEKETGKKVIILATGGTIAGVGEAGKTAGYKPGSLSAEDLIAAVPELVTVADIEAIQICNVNSDDITDEIWLELANKINELAKDPDVAGFVITHGTDTMEETAYFLNLVIKTDKPVVLTGSMRPATSISADGSMNLYEAVCVAASGEAVGQGVLVVFSDRIYSARSVTKTSTYHVTAISAGEFGAVGVVRDGKVYLYESTTKRHTVHSEFDVSGKETLPKVITLYFSVDADPGLLEYAAERAEGIVIAGAGAGEFSEAYKTVIETLTIPVVISSRIDDGIILPENLLCDNTVAADNLSPQKAAILLRLALSNGITAPEILQDIFLRY